VTIQAPIKQEIKPVLPVSIPTDIPDVPGAEVAVPNSLQEKNLTSPKD